MPGLEYFAGFFDGEGYIGVAHQRQGNYHMLKATVTNNNKDVLDLYKQRFGGSLATPKVAVEGHGKEAWTWVVNGPRAKAFLVEILPYLVVKKPQALLALEFPLLGEPGKYVSSEIKQKRHTIYEGLMELKRQTKTGIGVSELLPIDLSERDDIRVAMDLYKTGLTVEEVASQVGTTFGAVSYWTRELGVARGRQAAGRIAGAKRKDSVFTRPDAMQAKQWYDEGKSISQIARDLGAKPATVNYWLRQQGATRSLSEAQQLRRQREHAAS